MASFAEKMVLKIGFKNIYKVFKFFRCIYMVLDTISDTLFGYSLVNGWHHDRELAKAQLDKSGHLVRVLGQGTPNPAGMSNMIHFMLRHDDYIDPDDFVLNNDKVTLMGVNETQAWFSVTTSTDVYGLGKFPFVFMAHFFTSEKLLIVDHATLHRIADKLDDPQGNCILIANTGRSGSTLLCQMLRKVPNTIVMSEPWGLLYIHRMYNENKLLWHDYQRLLKTCVRLQYKRTILSSTERYVLKLPLLCSSMMKSIHDIFGQKIKIMLNTRHPKPSMLSFTKVFNSFEPEGPDVKGDFWFYSIGLPYGGKFRPIFNKYVSIRRVATDGQVTALGYGAVIACYLMHKDIYTAVLIYEEMIKAIEPITKSLFEKLNISTKYVPEAITALETHSQNNMFGSSALSSEDLITSEDWARADGIFQELEIPIKISMTMEDLSKLVHL